MNKRLSERRMIENEIVFRKMNEQLKKDVAQANDEGEELIELKGDEKLYFYCECSDENCVERIKMTPDDYDMFHVKRDVFTIVNGHEAKQVEEVIRQFPNYMVVKKYDVPDTANVSLKSTDFATG